MCEALVWIQDKVARNNPRAAQNYRAGEVICVQEDGWPWSERERTHPRWRIFTFPGVAVSALADLVAGDFDQEGGLIARRVRGFDLSTLPSDVITNRTPLTTTQRSALLASRVERAARVRIG